MEHYNIHLKKRNNHAYYGCCPIHQGDNPNAFHVNTCKNVFYCFTGCGAGGNVIDFVMKMENIPFYQAALKIYTLFIDKNNTAQSQIILKLNPLHEYLQKRGLDKTMVQYFGMGFCEYGIMKNRIAIPVHDSYGNPVAYCGRAIDNNIKPKYLFPKGFTKSNYLYNFHRIVNTGIGTCVIVEGFFDVFFLTKLGYNAIALMGCKIYPKQIEMLKLPDLNYVLMLDGDKPGRKGMISLEQLCKKHYINYKSIYLPINTQPENAGVEFLKKALAD